MKYYFKYKDKKLDSCLLNGDTISIEDINNGKIPIDSNFTDNEGNKVELKTTGEYKIDIKLKKFVSFTGTKLRFFTDEAIIEGKKLSSIKELSNVIFRLKIHDDNTISFDEIGTCFFKHDRKLNILRLLEDYKPTQMSSDSFVIKELLFKPIVEDESNKILYLEVEKESTYSRLKNLTKKLDRSKIDLFRKKVDFTEIDDKIKRIFKSVEEEEEEDVEERVNEDVSLDLSKRLLNEKFNESINSLNNELLEIEKSIYHNNYEIERSSNELDKLNKRKNLLKTRLEDISPISEKNEYSFYVKESTESNQLLDNNALSIISDRLSTIKGINVKNLLKLFTINKYEILFGQYSQNIDPMIMEYNLLEKLKENKFILDNDKFTIETHEPYNVIINNLLKLGFIQDHRFDKLCNGNYSYNQLIIDNFPKGSSNEKIDVNELKKLRGIEDIYNHITYWPIEIIDNLGIQQYINSDFDIIRVYDNSIIIQVISKFYVLMEVMIDSGNLYVNNAKVVRGSNIFKVKKEQYEK